MRSRHLTVRYSILWYDLELHPESWGLLQSLYEVSGFTNSYVPCRFIWTIHSITYIRSETSETPPCLRDARRRGTSLPTSEVPNILASGSKHSLNSGRSVQRVVMETDINLLSANQSSLHFAASSLIKRLALNIETAKYWCGFNMTAAYMRIPSKPIRPASIQPVFARLIRKATLLSPSSLPQRAIFFSLPSAFLTFPLHSPHPVNESHLRPCRLLTFISIHVFRVVQYGEISRSCTWCQCQPILHACVPWTGIMIHSILTISYKW